MKGYNYEERDETIDANGCRIFIKKHIEDVVQILEKVQLVNLTLSLKKSIFGVEKILIVEYMYKKYDRKPNPDKVNAISKMKVCNSITEVKRFLDVCMFYHIWVPHFAYISKPLYKLLKKGKKFI